MSHHASTLFFLSSILIIYLTYSCILNSIYIYQLVDETKILRPQATVYTNRGIKTRHFK